ncbi:MAG: LytR/AlgR family response regulator transcription factor [Flavobacteriales bacterium]
MIKAIIIDDEPLARSIVEEYLQPYSNVELVQQCSDGFEGVKAIAEHKPDLIFLDIQMPKLNGFEMLELAEPQPDVIFTTAFDEYAMRAFDANATDYLLKPFSKERFDKAMQKWMAQRNSTKAEKNVPLLNTVAKQAEESSRIAVRFGNKISIIPAQDIYYIEAFDDYVKIFTEKDYFLKKKTMSYFEQTLNAGDFMRVHRSFIVQLSQITRIEPYEKNGHIALLKNGRKIPLSRSGYAKLRERLGL